MHVGALRRSSCDNKYKTRLQTTDEGGFCRSCPLTARPKVQEIRPEPSTQLSQNLMDNHLKNLLETLRHKHFSDHLKNFLSNPLKNRRTWSVPGLNVLRTKQLDRLTASACGGGNFSLSSVFPSSSQPCPSLSMQVCEVNSSGVFQEGQKTYQSSFLRRTASKRGWMNFKLNFLQTNFKHTNSPNRVSQEPSGLPACECELSHT